MHLKLLQAAATVAIVGGTMTLGLGSTQAALAVPAGTPVGCTTTDLVNAMTGLTTPTVLDLATDCTYWLDTASLPTVTVELTIVGSRSTWIKRSYEDGTPSFSIFVVGSTGDLTLCGVNVANGGGSGTDAGGAVDVPTGVTRGTVTINGGIFNDNNTSEYGGAIANYGTLTVDDAIFTDNSTGEYGGAIYSQNGISTATLSHDAFSRNYSSEYGGAIANDDNDMTITASSFTKNDASNDGGEGGAIYNEYDLTVNGGSFSQNRAEYGGALYNNDDVTFNHSSLNRNNAYQGGGIYNDDETVYVNYSVITYNMALHGGGGIYNYEDDSDVYLTGDMISWNLLDNCYPLASITGCFG